MADQQQPSTSQSTHTSRHQHIEQPTQYPPPHLKISRKGGRLFFRHGYECVFERQNMKGTMFWRCAKKNTCNASVTTKQDMTVLNEKPHNHEPKDLKTVEVKQQMEKCANEVQYNIAKPIPQVFEEHMDVLKEKGYHDLPNFSNVSKHLYQKRNKFIGAKRLCFDKAADVEIPESFLPFVFKDYKYEHKRIIVFGHQDLVIYLKQSKLFF